jgi:RimJ/RimL family protein N-acetyltransferase
VEEGAATPRTLPLRVPLRDGRSAIVRPIAPEDRDALQFAVQSMSPDSRYTRFMSPKRQLSEQTLQAATRPKPAQECALVAVSADELDGPIIAGARYASAVGSDTCEFAVTIVDAWQGLGLARQLMEILIDVARQHGFRTMEGFVLTENRSMRGLAKRLGFRDRPSPGEPGVRLVTLSLEGGRAPPAGD